MAFNIANFNCIAVGPQNVYAYLTSDTISSNTWYSGFNTSALPSLRILDLIFITHVGTTGSTQLMPVVVERATSTGAYLRNAMGFSSAS